MKIYTLVSTAVLITFFSSFEKLNAQDIHFSQFTQSPLTVNPALAGTTAWIRGGLIYRSQWKAVTVPYKTFGASFDIKSKKRWAKVSNQTEKYRKPDENGFGWGVNFYNDRAGDGKMNSLQANGSLAYQIIVGDKSMLAAGFQAGILQRSLNFDKLYWGNQYDPSSPNGYNLAIDPKENRTNDHFIVPDLSAGMIYTYSKSERYSKGNDQRELTIGASMFHVNQPKYSFLGTSEKLDPRFVIHGIGSLGIENTNIALVPAFMFSKQGPNHEVLAGTMIRYMLKENSQVTGFIKGSSISLGGYYRNKDAFIATALFESASYGIGISYDINVSGLTTASAGRGGFEITLRFLNPSPFVFSQASFGK